MTDDGGQLPPRAGSYLPGIDGLRAVAVLSVMLFHLDARLLPGGFVGVDVFFVISGYVISRTLEKTDTKSLRDFLLSFYRRRVLRIFPALVSCLAITSVFATLFIPDHFWLNENSKRTGLWAFVGASNLYLVASADGYFSERVPFNPYLHTWSLAVEEQFYLLFPVIFFLWLRLRASGNRYQRTALVVMPIVAVLSLVVSAVETQIAPSRAFYLLPSRFWELAAGTLLYQLHVYRPNHFHAAVRWMVPLGALMLGLSFGLADEVHFPFPWAIVPVSAALLLIAGATTAHGRDLLLIRMLSAPVVSYVGRISYSLYLWHWPVFVLFRWTLGLSSPATWLMALVLTSVMAMLSYHIVELRFRTSRFFARQTPLRIVSGGAVTVGLASLSVATLFYIASPLGLSLSITKDDCLWRPYDLQCQPTVKHAATNRQLFVIGDSHAGAYTLMAHMAAARLGAEVRMNARPGCPVATLISLPDDATFCGQFYREMLDWLDRRARAGDIVFLASLRLHRLGDQYRTFDLDEVLTEAYSPAQIEVQRQALAVAKALVRQLQARGLHVLIDAPKPVFPSPPFRCSDWFNAKNPVCSAGFTVRRDFLLKYREPVMASLLVLNRDFGVYLWDPFPLLCPDAVCSAFRGDKPVFFDGDHLSGYGNRMLVEAFAERLSSIWEDRADARVSLDRR